MLGRRLKKLILIRLFLGSLFLYGPLIFPGVSSVAFYAATTFISLISLIYLLWYLTKRRLRWLALSQIFVDVLFVTCLVYKTGGTESLFASFYILCILSAALIMGEKQFVYQATFFSCLSYLGASLAFHIQSEKTTLALDPIYFFYSITVRIAVFLVVGQLSRNLSQRALDLEGRLKLSERLSFLGEVLSKISHEIRNPLSAIQTAAEVVRDSLNGKLSPQDERMITIIYQESSRLTKTLERILGYAKQTQPNSKVLLLDNLVERTLAMVRLRSELHPDDILVEKDYDPTKTHIYADEEQILGAMLNIALNAYQAMPKGGRFRISAVEDLTGTKLNMEDTGGGIPAEKLKNLFVPFQSTKKGGTGLGLAEVHKIVTLHDGKIEVEPNPEKGTIFHLYFPKP